MKEDYARIRVRQVHKDVRIYRWHQREREAAKHLSKGSDASRGSLREVDLKCCGMQFWVAVKELKLSFYSIIYHMRI